MAGFLCLHQKRKGGSVLAMEGELKKLPLIGNPTSLSTFCISRAFVHFSSVPPTHIQREVGVLWREMYKAHPSTRTDYLKHEVFTEC